MKEETDTSFEAFPYCKHSLLSPPKCLGLRLRPFSLGHIDILTATEHPLIFGSFNLLSRADVAAAALICSHDYESGVRLFKSGRAVRKMLRLGVKWGTTRRGFEAHRDTLTEYLSVYFMAPPRWDPEKQMRPVIPWHLSVFAALQRDLKYTPADVWNMPLPRALELFAAVAANRGDDSLIPIDEQQIIEAMHKAPALSEGGAL